MLLFGRRIAAVDSVEYFDPAGKLAVMNPKAYLLNGDRLILGLDCWPAVRQGQGSQVFIAYRAEEEGN